MKMDNELEQFKQINLVEYAASIGYELDKRESSKHSKVMRCADDKIIVATDTDGHSIYFSVRDHTDHGTIIDFIQRRKNITLGHVRKELRLWMGTHAGAADPALQKPLPSTVDRQEVLSQWLRMRVCDGKHPYMENHRGIDPIILSDSRFVGTYRMDDRGNAVFAHYDADGLAGYEIKGPGYTGFSRGGQKALWRSTNVLYAPRIVVVESAIDALSHAQVTNDHAAGYISLGGSMSDRQRDLVRSVMTKAHTRHAEVVIATDADDAGEVLARDLMGLAPIGLRVTRQVPSGGAKDWNDQLREMVMARGPRPSPGK